MNNINCCLHPELSKKMDRLLEEDKKIKINDNLKDEMDDIKKTVEENGFNFIAMEKSNKAVAYTNSIDDCIFQKKEGLYDRDITG